MRRLVIYLENLEERERWVLIAGLYAVVFIVGLFFITLPSFERLSSIDKKISKEVEKYVELTETISVYLSTKGSFKQKRLSLSEIEKIATSLGVKENIVTLKPYQDGGVEINLEDVNWSKLVHFVKRLKLNKYTVVAFYMEKPGEKKEVNVRIVIME